jgi:hypothetical protein
MSRCSSALLRPKLADALMTPPGPRTPGPPPPHRWAGRPRPVGLQVGAHRAQIQRPPAPPPLVLVEAKTAPPALAAATLGGLAGRTATTIASASSSKATRSTTARSTPSSLAHSPADRTPFPFLAAPALDSRNRSRGAALSHIRGLRATSRHWDVVDQARRAQRSVILPLVLWSVKTPEVSTV